MFYNACWFFTALAGGENYYGFLKKVRTHRKRKATCTKKKRTHRKKKRTHRKKKRTCRKKKQTAKYGTVKGVTNKLS